MAKLACRKSNHALVCGNFLVLAGYIAPRVIDIGTQ